MRTYYEIKPQYDGRELRIRTKSGNIGLLCLVAEELYTAKEIEKYRIPKDWYNQVSVKSTCFVFGARFRCDN